jgi:hypothetical protein
MENENASTNMKSDMVKEEANVKKQITRDQDNRTRKERTPIEGMT